MRIHGNYVGPNWSAGKRQTSVAYGRVPAVDEFDLSGKWHDHAYATGMDRKKADYLFYKWNYGKGLKRTVAALAVGAQGVLRSQNKNNNSMAPTRRKQKLVTPRQTPRSTVMTRMGLTRSKQVAKRGPLSKQRVKAARRTVVIAGSIGKRIKRSKRRVKKSKLDKGISTSLEFGSSIESSSAVYLGHHTSPAVPVYKAMVSAMFKKFFIKAEIDVSDFNAPVRYGQIGEFFKLVYRFNQNGTEQNFDYTTAANWTIQQVIDYYTVALTQSLASQGQLELLYLEFWPKLPPGWNFNDFRPFVHMELKQLRIEMSIVSELKMQNRSVSDTGSASTDVINSNPLIGRSYSGNGSGTATVSHVSPGASAVGFYAEGTYGGIAVQGTSQFLKEPPLPKDFTQVKYSKKIGINPGEVQTHVLTAKHNMYLNSYIRAFQGNPSNLLQEANNKLGKYSFVGLERMLYDGNETNPISVAFEIDLKIRACAYGNGSPRSTTINEISG